MAEIITMPKFGLTMEEGTLAKWLKEVGQRVEKGEAVAEVSTEKITNVLEAPTNGILKEIYVAEGETVAVGTPLGVVAGENEDLSHAEAQAVTESTINNNNEDVSTGELAAGDLNYGKGTVGNHLERIVSPMAIKLAKEMGVDLSQVKGTGPGGRVIKADVQAYLNQGHMENIDRIRLDDHRKIIAKKMYDSLQQTAQFTIASEIDVTELVNYHRDQGKKENTTYTDYIIKILTKILRRFPEFNSSLEGEEVLLKKEINIGIAVDAGGRLIVPVIHNCNDLDLLQIAAKRKDLVERAKLNSLKVEDIRGGTFTISNLGMMGVTFFTPIINIPESAILGVCKIVGKFEGQEDSVPAVRYKMNLCLTVDHRIIDGAMAARFLQEIAGMMGSPQETFRRNG
ncbi:MAG: dihydrolipoamide acetyltransferase family protein [Bacillota bacterium]